MRQSFINWLDDEHIEWLEVTYGEVTPEVTRAWYWKEPQNDY